MADPLTTFDLATVGIAAVSLATVIGVLWRAFIGHVNHLREIQLKTDKQLTDAVERIRSLEDSRYTDVKKYADEMITNSQNMLAGLNAATAVMRKVITIIDERIPVPEGKTQEFTASPQVDSALIRKTVLGEAKDANHVHG